MNTVTTKTTKPQLIALAKDQQQAIRELQTQQPILFIISGLLLISHFL